MTVQLTSTERVAFPATGTTKGEVIAYYERVAPRLLPHLVDRPLTLRRFPRGVGQKGFFQKNVPNAYPESMRRVEIPKHGGVTVHPCVSEAEHLRYLANQNVIELHVPTVRASDLHHPDRFVIDLDPPGGQTELVRRAAKVLQSELSGFGLPSVPIATGSKGYHVVVPIAPSVKSGTLAHAAAELGEVLAHRHPALFTTSFRINRRNGRVFVDWLHNRAPATVIAPWSLRARSRPSVAMPLTWEELDRVGPSDVELENIDAWLDREDPLLVLARSPVDPSAFVASVHAIFEAEGLVLEPFDRFRS